MDLPLIDFHCHLDLFPDPVSAIAHAEQEAVYTLAVTTTPKAWPRNLELTRNTKYVRAALGLHPQLVSERANEISLWQDYLPETRYIGEVGLDAGPSYYRSLDLQKQVFDRILQQCARAGGKILTVHSVRSATQVLDSIQAHLPLGTGRVVLHWFTGSKSEALRALGLGCYFSINGPMTRNEKGRALIATIPSDRLLTETDGPFTQVGNRPARPSDVKMTVETLAALRGCSTHDMAATIKENLRSVLDHRAT